MTRTPTTDLNADLSDEELHTLDLLIPDAPRDSPKNALASLSSCAVENDGKMAVGYANSQVDLFNANNQYDLIVVTRNDKHFRDTGVRLLNPFTE